MRKFNTTNIKKLITVAAVVLSVNAASAKTYVAIHSGKWSDASIWENGAPGNLISADDVVIVKNHVTMNTDVAVRGTLTIDKGMNIIGNKSLFVAQNGKVINNGNLTVKNIVNEGTISNNAMMEAMTDMDNKGIINNNQNLMAGANINSIGGTLTGNSGSYFANGKVTASAIKGDNLKIYHDPAQAPIQMTSDTGEKD